MSKNDDLLAAPGLANATKSAGGGDMSPIATAIASLKSELIAIKEENQNLRSSMEGYFGFGGSAVKGIGRETVKSLEGGVI